MAWRESKIIMKHANRCKKCKRFIKAGLKYCRKHKPKKRTHREPKVKYIIEDIQETTYIPEDDYSGTSYQGVEDESNEPVGFRIKWDKFVIGMLIGLIILLIYYLWQLNG